jgi:hypothetical protein
MSRLQPKVNLLRAARGFWIVLLIVIYRAFVVGQIGYNVHSEGGKTYVSAACHSRVAGLVSRCRPLLFLSSFG